MPSNNEVKQRIILDSKDAVKAIKDYNRAVSEASNETSSKMTNNSQAFAQNEKQVKTWGQTTRDELTKFKKSFTDNLATGAKALTLDAGLHAVKQGMKDSIALAANSSEVFAELKSRVGASEDQMNKWQRSISSAAISTKTNLASMERAFMDLSDSADPSQIEKFLTSIGQATMLAHGNEGAVTGYLKSTIVGQGRTLDKGSVDESLGAADLLRRRGRGFGRMEDAMGALGGLDQTSVAQSKLSERDIAAYMAAASKSGLGASQATSVIGDLLKANSQGQLNALGGILRIGKLTGANGQMDLSRLSQAQRVTHLGGDENTSREIFRNLTSQAGMSGEGSDALFRLIRNSKDFSQALQEARGDTKAFSKSADEAGNNIKATYEQLQDKLAVGFRDMFGPLMKPLNSLIGGHPLDAGAQAMRAAPDVVGGMAKHPGLILGGVLATAAGGSLINGLLKRLGGGGVASAAGLAKGVGIGSALKEMGVQPVYVVNAQDFKTDSMTTPGGIRDMLGGGGAAAGGAAAGGKFMGVMTRLGLNARLLGGASMGEIGAMGAGSIGMAAAGVAGAGAVGYGVTRAAIGGTRAESYFGDKAYDLLHPQKVVVEIHNKADGFDAKPTSKGMTRDARTQ